ncbi:MAG TPA: arylesterase [Amaricoccus sp.]|uniref:arylesterase n=1 Tax=Amaricoccus sp. TaxID=1872485 RepID=UPI002B731854|nr:arylesterase [Amaricoccus sp.]HMQ92939.1 arylesterase [Amaricoccus sp.]HMR52465.1 arylesterase [Amaricoccus sp.]HMR59392.1 arylesterase [Amaricoccus sp.]HMT99379.1 arylesterase [Amaricoccus sp.]
MRPTLTLPEHSGGYGAGAAIRKLAFTLALLLAGAGAAAAEVRILAFGDSLTQGFGLPEDQGFVPRLQAWLRANGAPDAVVINAGVSGDTTAGGLARIDWALGEDPDAVIVELGANDMLRGLDTGEMRANLDGILATIEARGLPMILAGLPAPPNYGEEYRKAFKGMFRDLARQHGAIYYSSFLAGMGEGRNMFQVMRLMQSDGLHPNAEGVEAIVAHIGPVVLELIGLTRR